MSVSLFNIRLPEAYLFDKGQRRLSQLCQFGQRDLGSPKTFSINKCRISLYFGMERVFLVEVGKEFLPCLCHEEFHEQLRAVRVLAGFRYSNARNVHDRAHSILLLVRHKDRDRG